MRTTEMGLFFVMLICHCNKIAINVQFCWFQDKLLCCMVPQHIARQMKSDPRWPHEGLRHETHVQRHDFVRYLLFPVLFKPKLMLRT